MEDSKVLPIPLCYTQAANTKRDILEFLDKVFVARHTGFKILEEFYWQHLGLLVLI